MDRKQRYPTECSKSENEEDPIGTLTGRLSNLALPSPGATSRQHSGAKVPTLAERLFADSKKAGTEDGLLFDPADFPDSEQDEMLEKFIETSAPSKVNRSDGIGWIRVISASFDIEGLPDQEALEADWKTLQESGETIDFEAVKKLAISNRCLGGIWLLFFKTGKAIDTAWGKIAKATVKDELGSHAKVTPREDGKEHTDLYGEPENHVVSVYTRDFTDTEDVFRVEGALRRLGFRDRIVFKPRIYSCLGVYSKNKWNLRPSIYTSQWDYRQRAGSIRDSTKSRDSYAINCQGNASVSRNTTDKKQRRPTDSNNSENEEDPTNLEFHPHAVKQAGGSTPRNRHARGGKGSNFAERSYADSKKSGTEDGLLFDPANYSDRDEQDEMLEKFIATSAPSKVKRSEGIGWIRVVSPSFDREGLGDLENLETDWENLKRSKKTIDFESIKTLALSNGCLGGIWLLFFNTGNAVDAAWDKIAKATVKDELGTHAKVTPCEDGKEEKDLYGEQHAVSVYTRDFTDTEDVFRVEGALRRLGFRDRIVFKPRVYSSLGVYSQNKWNLKPGIYTSHWDARKRAGNIRDSTKSRDIYMINYQGSD